MNSVVFAFLPATQLLTFQKSNILLIFNRSFILFAWIIIETMITKKLIFILSISLFLIVSCKKEQPILLTGSIHGYANQMLYLFSVDSVFRNNLIGLPTDSVITDSLGNFNLKFQKSVGALYFVDNRSDFVTTFPIITHGAKHLSVTLSHFNSLDLSFEGNNASVNNLLIHARTLLDKKFRNPDIFSQPFPYFSTIINDYRTSLVEQLDSIAQLHSPTEYAVNFVRAEIDLKLATLMARAIQYQEFNSNWHFNASLYSNIGLADGKAVLETYKEYWFLPAYSQLAELWMSTMLNRLNPNSVGNHSYESYIKLANEQLGGTVQKAALASITSQSSQFLYSPSFFSTIEQFDSLYSCNVGISTLNKFLSNWRSRVSKLKPGEMAPNFSLKSSSGNNVQLSDYKGRVIFLAFWATWCGPCLDATHKHLKMQLTFRNKDVEFIYVAMERNSAAVWRNFIAGKGNLASTFLSVKPFPGVHCLAIDNASRN